ncbi:uroporphyrinogen-III synthase hemD [Candidatus Kinetoplastibacterium blastocrithidii TCC012E]|uniref:Uroporphyrinogen-III synthase hemD n=2 Tax=Candidatus Kinetoplastidibacterium blastocrithidiae TaxID=233181 RepID=M1LVR7_9PROT|nr:uroporphyrinogen-III synthase [Candidatus Kinetoplastibacterium blastocrithidii]AEM25267.1 uroporphyrinogen III synthase [Candidatus Kinetoplastibacterium blastocrithidii]AFZ83528.1 hypothetical protein CKBE_00339 [Candidatus Kinetoplastibacterium blastocrithidii (ex Strigomonas culicis)]AGF49647.1 uroporphyrinogen-III synthase hemD [Candidatus Kinetoplastibacterium blastocrithidii TCC012E]
MLAQKVFILTRPNSNKILSDSLNDAGFETLSLPSLKIKPFDLKDVPFPGIYDFIFFSSGNAVRCYLILLNKIYGTIEWPSSTIVVTVGVATANSFRSSDLINIGSLTVLSPNSSALQIDSESLWDVLKRQCLHGKRFLFVRGSTGRDWLINKVSEYCEVDLCSVYFRDNVEWSCYDSGRLKVISERSAITVWLFTSIESIEATIRNIVLLNLEDWFSSCRFIVTHQRIYNFLSSYFIKCIGFNKVVIKECLPYDESIIMACKSI